MALIQDKLLRNFAQHFRGVIVTRYFTRHPLQNPLVKVTREHNMPHQVIFLSNGDKGDAARVINVPVLTYEDSRQNATQVALKGVEGSKSVLIVQNSGVGHCQCGDIFACSMLELSRHWADIAKSWFKEHVQAAAT